MPRRCWLRWLLACLFLVLAVVALGVWNAKRDPVVRTADLAVRGWPTAAPPMRVLLMSDIHMAGPDMTPEKLTRLVRDFNALKPDLVVIAGDFISGKRYATRHYSPAQIAAPLAGLRAPLGTVAVIGNHDYWHEAEDQVRELRRIGVVVLRNNAVRRGPLILGGVDDIVTDRDDLPATLAAMQRLGRGPRAVLTHSPDVVPDLPSDIGIVLAGHTHCGQIHLPIVGALTYASDFGDRFACGAIAGERFPVFVTAGLGTSIVPLRYGARPDVWLLTLGASAAVDRDAASAR